MAEETKKAQRTKKRAVARSTAGEISPIKLELLITVIESKKADSFADLIQSYGSNIQMKILARGAANRQLQEYLGLSDKKVALFSVIRSDRRDEIMNDIEEKFRTVKQGKGVSVAVPFSSVIGKLVFGFMCNDQRLI